MLGILLRDLRVVNDEEVLGVVLLGPFVKLNDPVMTTRPSMTMTLL